MKKGSGDAYIKKKFNIVIAKMEDILEVYALLYDAKIPIICMDKYHVPLLDDKFKGKNDIK